MKLMQNIPNLHRQVSTKQVTPEQEAWLLNAINPFPDYSESPARMPSHTMVRTAAKIVQKVINISAPTLDSAGATTWTANIFLLPVDGLQGDSAISALSSAFFKPYLIQDPEPLPTSGGFGLLLVVKSWDNGGETANPFSPDFKPYTAQYQFISLMDSWAGEGAARITSIGYEVVDNTAEVFRSGNMVSWRKSSMAAETPHMVTKAGTVRVFAATNRMFSGFPSSLEEAFRIPGSLSTRFPDGTYVVGTFNRNKESFELPSNFGSASLTSEVAPLFESNGLYAGYIGSDAQTDGRIFSYTHLDHSGSFCTGLLPQATFTLTLKAVLEILPNAGSVLIDFTQASVPFNPRIDQLYEHVVAAMPPSTLVENNAGGDFFKSLVDIATPMVSTLFPGSGPLVNLASKAATTGIQALQDRRQANLQKPKPPKVVTVPRDKILVPMTKQEEADYRQYKKGGLRNFSKRAANRRKN